jgi:hypothetical protein
MKNLRSVRALRGSTVQAPDGIIGRVRDLLFDDQEWLVRYLVVDLGRWLPNQKILLPPSVVVDAREKDRMIRVSITREQVQASPRIDDDLPVVLQRRAERRGRHNWALHLAGEAIAVVPELALPLDFEAVNRGGRPFDPHLRTTRVAIGLRILARGVKAGSVVDLVIDETTWAIRYLIVETGEGERRLLLPQLVGAIRLEDHTLAVDLPREVIAACPALDPATLLTRPYEEAVAEHYRVEGYWNAGDAPRPSAEESP